MKYVGLDVHKDSIAVAVAEHGAEARFYGEIPMTSEALGTLVRRSPKTLRFAYEAGPCGYGVYRTLTQLGADCLVAAPSLIPQRPGDRVKTDRRDACGLARPHRAGELTAVWIPDEGQEAIRDLTRAREDAKRAETHARQRLGAFLLRHGFRFTGRTRWSRAYFAWLTTLPITQPMQRVVLEEYRQAVEDATARVRRLTAQLETGIRDRTRSAGGGDSSDSFAEYEPALIATRIRSVLAAKRRRGERVSRFAPYGYRFAVDGRVEPDPTEQPTLARIREARSAGPSLARIARELNQDG